MTQTPRIEIIGLSKRFGEKVVLDNLSLSVPAGQSLVILGGSGTGKSVLLKCILGLIRPDSGKILLDGKDITFATGAERENVLHHFGMLFQGGALFDSLRVWENVSFRLYQTRQISKTQAMDLAVETLAKVGLPAQTAKLFPSELSGGMQKRVSLARAIAAKPSILFFDEPTTGLDPIMAQVINTLIVDVLASMNITGITITHDMHSMKTIAKQVAMIYKGKILWQGDVSKIEHSGNAYVDQFIHGRTEGPIPIAV